MKIKLIIKKLLDVIIELIHNLGLQKNIITDCKYKVYQTNYKHTFLGYYDKTPFSGDNTKLLAMATNYDKSTSTNESVVGYFDLDNGDFKEIDTTTTWSWQLGARLQWMPGDENNTICYNRLVKGKLGSVVQNIHTGEIKNEYTVPVFDISPNGEYALGVNFSRLYRKRKGYGYSNLADSTLEDLVPENDGVIRLNLKSGSSEVLLSLSFIANFKPVQTMKDAEHYINHIAFSPNGERFYFVHLWSKDGKNYSRGFTCNIEGDEMYLIEEESNLSHYTWKSDSALLIHTSRHPNGVSFNLYNDQAPGKRKIGEEVLVESGHPSYSPDGSHLIVDTYPDYTRIQRLLLCSEEGLLVEQVGRFYSPPSFIDAQKCDLHPRWNRSGTQICIDSSHQGYRTMCVIDLLKQ